MKRNLNKAVFVDSPQDFSQPSIFLAGPTPRRMQDVSWRIAALQLFEQKGFEGLVFIPEHADFQPGVDYSQQLEWEWQHLHAATVILFWVPRKLPEFPGFTTNIEAGFYWSKRPDACLYGRPEWAEKTSYLDWLYEKTTGKKPFDTLDALITAAVELCLSE